MISGFVVGRLVCSSLLGSVLGGTGGPRGNPHVVVERTMFQLWGIWRHIDVDDLIRKAFLVEFTPVRPRLLPCCTWGDRLGFGNDCSG